MPQRHIFPTMGKRKLIAQHHEDEEDEDDFDEDEDEEVDGDQEEEEEDDDDEDDADAAAAPRKSSSAAAAASSSKFINKQRTLIIASRGISHRDRHLLADLRDLMPHSKKDSKFDGKVG